MAFNELSSDMQEAMRESVASLKDARVQELQAMMHGAGVAAPNTVPEGRMLRVIDVGCGPGLYARALADRLEWGHIVGVDPDPMAKSGYLSGADRLYFRRGRLQDLQHGDGGYDLALCLEVAEHIPIMGIREFIGTLCTLAPILIFAAAAPGQGGDGHILMREKSYWLELFAQFGFKLDQPKTTQLCQYIVAGPHMGWFTQNVMVLTSYGYRNFAHIEREDAPQAERLASFVAEQLPGWLTP